MTFSMENNVLSWGNALKQGYQPGLYPYSPDEVPIGEVRAVLDFKVWAKKIMAISCYFTEVESGRHFKVTAYCTRKGFVLNDGGIDFSTCPTNRIYHLTIVLHPKSRTMIGAAKLL